MRILHIAPDYFPSMGGAESHVREVSERLARRGHDVTVLALNSRGARARDGSRLPTEEMLNGVRIRRLHHTYSIHQRILRIRGAYRVLRILLGKDRWQMLSVGPCSPTAFVMVMTAGADVVGFFNWYHGALAYQTSVARQLRKFAYVAVPMFHTERPWAHWRLHARALSRCDAVVANTEHEKRFVESLSQRQNATVVGVGIEPSSFSTADGARVREKYGLGDAPVVGFIGRMSSSKGVVTVLEAMKTVWRDHPRTRLLLAGSGAPPGPRADEDVRVAFDSLTAEQKARTVTIASPSEEEKPSLFDALDVFAMPSVAESFGITYLEAWMCGKPVIGSRMGSTECVIRDGVDGLLVDPTRPDELAAAMVRLLNDPAYAQQLGAAGRAKTLSTHTWERVADRIERIYGEVCSHHASEPAVRRPVA